MSLDSVTEYALSFSGDAVHLQQRQRASAVGTQARQQAWRHLGSVDFDEPSFRDALARLRVMATGEEGDDPLPVTMVIPDDQILYTTLTVAPSVDRQHAVGRALDGLTPYAIDELSFDWQGDGDTVRVAAVARQTLREARDFAAQYGFQGDAYCADPNEELFPGEPVFVLDPPARARPVVDPALAGVTAAELMFKDDPAPEPAPAPAEAKADDPVTPAEVKAEDLELPSEQAEQAADAALPETASDTAKEPATETAFSADPVADDRTQAAPVVRHPPVAGAAPSPEMNPRARAIHERAAEARQSRSAGAAPAAPPHRVAAGYRGGLAGLVGMLAALVVGLVLIWAFVVPDRQSAQIVAASENQPAPAAQTPAAPVEDAPAPEAELATDPVETAPIEPAEQAALPDTSPAQVEADPVALPDPVEEFADENLAPPAPPISALTEAEARRVVVAAAAVAAAVVPPPGSRAQSVLPVTAEPAPEPAPAPIAAAVPAPAPVVQRPATATPAASPAPRAATAPVATAAASTAAQRPVATRPAATAPRAPQSQRLTSSARPQLAPRRSTPQTSEPRVDAAPRLPQNPLPYTASQRSSQPVRSARPPARNRAVAVEAAVQEAVREAPRAAATPAATQTTTRGSARPPQRPEGSAPDLIQPEGDGLAPDDHALLDLLRRDLSRLGPADPAFDGDAASVQLADARPVPRPARGGTASDAVSPSAVQNALRSATAAPPDRPAPGPETAAAPARDPGGLLRGSARPNLRPQSGGAGVSAGAVESAVAAAVEAAPASPGGVRLSALRSSPPPPRRSDAAPATAQTSDRPDPAPESATAPEARPEVPAAATAAAAQGPSEAEIAARRALDEQLQSQAEARIRARAQADAAAEAQARAQAEARARAQAEAEERTARARRQDYKPPEIDNEPEIAANTLRGGTTAANVAKSATQSRAMNTSRTTIIGIIGAGDASRALIRLRNGKIVTVRLGDRIDGGTINSIGDGKLTYVKSGQQRELRMLDGR
ncbi:hypothetical protein [Paracoccus laeviglucosivorans]|uniref:Meckel syndrome type 1 protein n=1 Tax=Paracoccus laeviglucosivorans TaxID=1197861 RepID=A0A521CQP5_9RHOB|nr:hypothetical protein [Paracoccus laeviglucosivorans]SMO61772.1 hypothetical protein SAMN06265221_10584 [Paracoccus laeviglucosivorans]